MRIRILAAALASAGVLATNAHAVTEIQWWHAMGGRLGEKVNLIAKGFNESQKDYKLVPVYKGNYTETMTGAIAAFRAKQQPHIVQVFEVGTASMMGAKGAIYPVYQLMKDNKLKFNPADYLPTVTGYYSDSKGNMLSMPFNSSTPVLYYNKDQFKKAGLDPEKPPKTWAELGEYAKKLQASGVKCGLTTGWQSWVQIENFSAWHDIPLATKQNGFGGLDTKFTFNNKLVIKHIDQLAQWQKTKIFDYGGRRSDSAPKFYTQECAMYMNSSAAYAGIKTNTKSRIVKNTDKATGKTTETTIPGFNFGVGQLPYYPEVKGAPRNTIIGGATLWVLRGHPASTYKGVGAFFNYLSSPEVQADWHQFTGYLPITLAAAELTRKQGFYDKNPGTDVAIMQMTAKKPTANSKGLRFGNFVQIRDIINEELEGVWAGKKSAKQALDLAVSRGNELLRKFEAASK